MSLGSDFERRLDEKVDSLRARAKNQERAARISEQQEHTRWQAQERADEARRVNQTAVVDTIRNNAKLVAGKLPLDSADYIKVIRRPNPAFVPKGFLRSIFSVEPDTPREVNEERALWILGSVYVGTNTEWETRHKSTCTTSTYKSIAIDSRGELISVTTSLWEIGYRGRVFPSSIEQLLYGDTKKLNDDELAPIKAIPPEIDPGLQPDIVEFWNDRLLGLLESSKSRQLREITQDDIFSEIQSIRA